MKRLSWLVPLVLAACSSGGTGSSGSSGGGSTSGTAGNVTRIVVSPGLTNLQPGQTGQLTAQAFDASHNMLPVAQTQFAWVSRTPSDVLVNSSGQVTALQQGSSDIAATYLGVTGVGTVVVSSGGSSGSTGGGSHTLTVVVVGDGAVSSNVGGINCGISTGSNCSATYADGTAVNLSTQSFNGSTFQGWSGAPSCGTAATCDLTIQSDLTVTATFGAACPNPPGCTWFDGGACPPACCAADWSCGGGSGGSKVCRVVEGNATVPSGSYCVDPPVTQTFCSDDSSCLFGDVCAVLRDGSGCPCDKECMPPLTAGLPARASCGPDAGDCTSGLCLEDGTGAHCAWLCNDNPFDVNPCDGGGLICVTQVGSPPIGQCVPPPADFRVEHITQNPVQYFVGASVAGPDQLLMFGKSAYATGVNVQTNRGDFNGSGGINDPRAPNFSSGAAWPDFFTCLLDDDGGAVSCGPLNGNGGGLPQLDAGVLVASGARALVRGVNDLSRLYVLDASGVSVAIRDDAGNLGAPAVVFAGSADLLGTGDDGTLVAASGDGHTWVGGAASPDIPLASATVRAVSYGAEPIAIDSLGLIWRLPSANGWVTSSNFTIANASVAAADGADNLLVGGPDGLWAGLPNGAFDRVWRGIAFVGFVPGAPDGGNYEVAIDQSGYLLIRP